MVVDCLANYIQMFWFVYTDCSDGFELVSGWIQGPGMTWGQFGTAGRFLNVTNTDECAQKCVAMDGCNSYEYSKILLIFLKLIPFPPTALPLPPKNDFFFFMDQFC